MEKSPAGQGRRIPVPESRRLFMSAKLVIAETEPDTAATVTERDAYRPAGVFISYAWEDHDLAQAVYQSLQALGESVYDRVKVFLDSKSIGEGDDIRDDIRQSLEKSDFLIVLYTGVRKQSHYTGWEVGFFDALMQQE